MSKQRTEERVTVDFPFLCTVKNHAQPKQWVTLPGKIDDLTINGMKIRVPLPPDMLADDYLDFDLELPKPFAKIRGNGAIQWKRWNAEKQCTTCGVKLEPLTLDQLTDLDVIVNELQMDGKK